MRPVASTCKVGTRFKGFVVKTRKANQHSNRRVKYWAKVSTSKAKPKRPVKRPSLLARLQPNVANSEEADRQS